MPTAYSYTEQIVTKDTVTGNVLSDQTIVHTITWQDADTLVYRNGKIAEATAVRDALSMVGITTEKSLIDYDTAAKKTAGVALNQDMVDRAKAMNLLLFPEWFKQADASADAHLTADSQARAAAFAPLFDSIKPTGVVTTAPRYISGPGEYAVDSAGSMLSLDASHYVYRDGRPMKTSAGTPLAAGLVVIVGKTIYARGFTVPDWWAWTGSGWLKVTDGDPSILTPA